MNLKKVLPWQIYHPVEEWMEKILKIKHPSIYKLFKFGRTNINTPDYWNHVWSNDKIQRNYSELFKIIVDRIPLNAKVLDIGCGVGRLSLLIKEKCGADVTGLDFSTWACEQLSKKGIKTIVSSLPEIPAEDNYFDVAVATEVIEHLSNPELTIKQMARVVRPGGIIMCSVPNDTLHPHEDLEHQQIFNESLLYQLLNKYSSEVEIITGKLLEDAEYEFLLGKAVIS